MAGTTLYELYNKHKKGDWPDKGSTHSYIEVYEEFLAPYRHTAKNVLEIGLMSGESLRMWDEYFAGFVCGMDCDIKPVGGLADLTGVIAAGYEVFIGDAANAEDVKKHFKKTKFDVVIEDANHNIEQQLKIFENFKPHMAKGGIYIIEDVQDIDKTRHLFERMWGVVIDRRHIKGRYDDVLVVIRM